ncbi:MAG: TIGR01212 family radical SAM protein [Bacteroidales bacterium]|nr:TIGR01212 family radical SAM protein [Bacteroidales bacterium]
MDFGGSHRRRFNSYIDHMRGIYGSRVQKLAIDAGFTCPNRDGTKGRGGCTFCLNDAFNPSYCDPARPVRQQIAEGIEFHRKRYKRACNYVAYFQAYSNTHAPVSRLTDLINEALGIEGIVGIVVATRPDCVDDEKLGLFRALSDQYYVMIEYGIESVFNKTLERVNRCHSFEDTARAIRMTAARGIRAGGHMIFGLPGETRDEMLQSAGIVSELPLTSIKFHQLQIFRGTAMEQEYLKNPGDFHLFGMEDYLEFLADYIELLNPGFIIERVAAETPPRYAFLPSWGPRYDTVLMKFERLLEERNSWQGKRFVFKL